LVLGEFQPKLDLTERVHKRCQHNQIGMWKLEIAGNAATHNVNAFELASRLSRRLVLN